MAAADGSVTVDGGLTNEEAKNNSKLYNFYSDLNKMNDKDLIATLRTHNEKVRENKKKWDDAKEKNKNNFNYDKDVRGDPTLREKHSSDDKRFPKNFSQKRARQKSTYPGHGKQGRRCLESGNKLEHCRHLKCQNQHDLTNEPERCTTPKQKAEKSRRR